jgi:hypothetical protein
MSRKYYFHVRHFNQNVVYICLMRATRHALLVPFDFIRVSLIYFANVMSMYIHTRACKTVRRHGGGGVCMCSSGVHPAFKVVGRGVIFP